MKNFIIFIAITVTIFSYTEKGRIYIEVEKDTNSNYMYSLPKLELRHTNGFYIDETNLSLKFFAPRSNMNSLNHYSVELEKNYGINYNGFFATFGVGLEYFFEDNNSLNPKQHIDFNNKLRIGYEF